MFSGMDNQLQFIADRQGGIFTHQDALRCGYSATQVHAQVRAGAWRRVRRGHYTVRTADPEAPPWERERFDHRLETTAAVMSLTGDVVVSHQSAAVLHGLPTWGADLARVHVTRRDRAHGKVLAGVCQHQARLPDDLVRTVDRTPVVSPARAVVEVACRYGFAAGVAIADDALHRGLATPADLTAAVELATRWPGSAAAARAVAFADGRAESVGESRLRVLFQDYGLPAPVPQHVIEKDGAIFAVVDFFFPRFNTVVEFDGLLKYKEDAADVVIREKLREDYLRSLGLEVVRIIWDELDAPHEAVLRVLRALVRGGGMAA